MCSRFRKGYLGRRSGDTSSLQNKKCADQGGKRTLKIPFKNLDNLSNELEQSSMMAHRRPTFDPHGNENALLVGGKFPRSHGGNIKEKISQWEGKDSTHTPSTAVSPGPCTGLKRTDSLTKSKTKPESCRRAAQNEKQGLGKENLGKLGDSRPCSPVETIKQHRGMLKSSDSKPSENQQGGDCRKVTHKEKQKDAKENTGELEGSRPCSPMEAPRQQVGTLRKSNDRKGADQSQEKRAVFTLFKKLELAMGENHVKTPSELGNYFCPPSKDKQVEAKTTSQNSSPKSPETREGKQHQENVYTEPGAPPINPVPKPQRTFQHPPGTPMGKTQRQGRGRRNLPPLPSVSPQPPTSQAPPGIYRRPRGDRARDNNNR